MTVSPTFSGNYFRCPRCNVEGYVEVVRDKIAADRREVVVPIRCLQETCKAESEFLVRAHQPAMGSDRVAEHDVHCLSTAEDRKEHAVAILADDVTSDIEGPNGRDTVVQIPFECIEPECGHTAMLEFKAWTD